MTIEQVRNTADRSTQEQIKLLTDRVVALECALVRLVGTNLAQVRSTKEDNINNNIHKEGGKGIVKGKGGNHAKELPIDFVPDLAYPLHLGWPREKVELEAERFRNWALAKGARFKRWDLAWRNWCTSQYQQKENGNGAERPKSERERYGELLHSVRSDGLRNAIAGVISDCQAGRSGGVSRVGSASLHQLPIRSNQQGGTPVRDTIGTRDLFADNGADRRLHGRALSDSSNGAVKAIEPPSDTYADD